MASTSQDRPAWPVGWVLAALVAAAAAWAAIALARHPAFEPAYTLRLAAPALAVMLGAAVTHAVARLRRRVDVEGEFNPTGKSLFLGAIMVAVTVVAWLVVSHAFPSTFNAILGSPRTEAGTVAQRVPLATDPDCRFRLEVVSASTVHGAITRPLDECVDEALWKQVAAGEPVTLQLVSGALGAELVGVLSAGAAP